MQLALHYQHTHPELTFRADALVLAQFRALRLILAELRTLTGNADTLPSDMTELSGAWLSDLEARADADAALLEAQKNRMP